MGGATPAHPEYHRQLVISASELALPGTHLQFKGYHAADAWGGQTLSGSRQDLSRYNAQYCYWHSCSQGQALLPMTLAILNALIEAILLREEPQSHPRICIFSITANKLFSDYSYGKISLFSRDLWNFPCLEDSNLRLRPLVLVNT